MKTLRIIIVLWSSLLAVQASAELPSWIHITDYREREKARHNWLRGVRYTRAVEKADARRARIKATAHLTPAQKHYGSIRIYRRIYR